MRILYVAMRYDYGFPERGPSFEHYNFYECLTRMGVQVDYFDFMSIMNEVGKERMNELLFRQVEETKPDVMFTCIFKGEIEPETLRRITERTETTTVNWFCDDHWRFDNFSKFYAPCFDWVTTTAKSALPKYDASGFRNVIKTQWACNPFIYRRLSLPLTYDMTFIGQPHGDRKAVVDCVRHAGLDIQTWGNGWKNGRISQDNMIRVFNQSRINLNLSNASVVPQYRIDLGRRGRTTMAALSKLPGGWIVKKFVCNNVLPLIAPSKPDDSVRSNEQIKGRNFEVPGCGGFMLTGEAEDLASYYTPGKEIACFRTTEELIELASYYLDNEVERQEVALRGYERTLHEHTYIHRFAEIFERIGHPLERTAAEMLQTLPTSEMTV
jgi:spore maturation protein CgeB